MANQSYLLSATVSGIKSIEKPVTINFYKKIVGRNFNPEKYRVKAIYGENGAGKSAIITAFSIFKNLLIDEDYLADSNNQRLLKELINKKLKRFWLECEYLIEDNEELHIYRYQIELKLNEKDRYEITYEHLESRNGKTSRGKYKEIFASKNGELNIIDSDSHDILTKISYNLLGIRSIVSIFFTNINQFLNKKAGRLEYALLFCIVLGLRIQVYLENEDRHELYFLKKKFLEELDKEEVSSEFVEYLRNYIESIGVNEKSVRVELFEGYQRKVNDLYKFIKLFKKDLQSIEIDKKENGEYYECELIFDYGNYKIAREFESTGIKKLVNLFDSLLKASNGFIVFIDEMDSNINDVYLCKLVEYFMYYGNGQLCFTTHNIDPMSVLKENKNSIEFLSNDNILIPWTKKGNSSPENAYKNGLIANLPFNVTSADFVGILGGGLS